MTLNTLLTLISLLILSSFVSFLWLQRKVQPLAKTMLALFGVSSVWLLVRLSFADTLLNEELTLIAIKITLSLVAAAAWLVVIFVGQFLQKKTPAWLKVITLVVVFVHAGLMMGTNWLVDGVIPDEIGGFTYDPGPGFFVFGAVVVLPLVVALIEVTLGLWQDRKEIWKKMLIWLGVASPLLVGVSTGIVLPLFGIDIYRYGFMSVAVMALLFVSAIQRDKAFNLSLQDVPINARILGSFILSSLIPLFILMYVSFQTSSNLVLSQTKEAQQASLTSRVESFESLVDHYAKSVSALVGAPAITSFHTSAEETEDAAKEASNQAVRDLFTSFIEADSNYLHLSYLDQNGTQLVLVHNENEHAQEVADNQLLNKRDEAYFQAAISLSPGETYISDPILNKDEESSSQYDQALIVAAAPVFGDDGQKEGLVVASLMADQLIATVNDSDDGEGKLVAFDEDGYYLFHFQSDLAWSGKDDLDTGFNIASKIENTADLLVDQPLVLSPAPDVYWVIAPVRLQSGVPSFYLLEEYSIRDQLASFSLFQKDFVKWSSALVVLVLVGGVILVRSISGPIYQLLAGIKYVREGNFEYRVPADSLDELGELGRAFNSMSNAIQNSQREIQQKVADQTREIQQKNQDLENQQTAVLNILEDIEEEKERVTDLAGELKKFQLAVENASDQVVITDPDGYILYANPATENITGHTISEMMGKKAGSKELWGGKMSNSIYEEMWATIKEEKKPFSAQLENIRKNGDKYVVQANISPVLNTDGELQFIVGIERDITREHEVDRMKTEFLSLASHQLRTPLTSIKWYIEILKEKEGLDEETASIVKTIDDSNDRMISLVNALLNVSRIESGRIIVDPQPTDLKSLLESVIDELHPALILKHHELVTELSDNIPVVSVDPKLIRQVFTNILSNSIKYTPDVGKITVKMYEYDQDIVTQFSDNGFGIPEGEHSRIFEKFFRADNIAHNNTDGTGLGLYLVKLIVEVSGGKIWFESGENKGTSFWVALPKAGSLAKAGEVSLS